MRIDVDFIDCSPVFSIDFWFKTLKIGHCFTNKGYARRIERLKNLTQKKVRNIDCFFKKWYARHSPTVTDWDGKLVEKNDSVRQLVIKAVIRNQHGKRVGKAKLEAGMLK